MYDFVEFVAQNFGYPGAQKEIHDGCNYRLEAEMAGYRFIGAEIAPITDAEEIAEIEEAAKASQDAVATHINRALELLSDRQKPDYRNSIKESISAVETLVAIEVGTKKGTLGQLLKQMEKNKGLHPALKTAFSNLYGYTNDEDGIRHKLMDAATLTFTMRNSCWLPVRRSLTIVYGKKSL